MGRLVDNIMAAMGLKPSDRVVITADSQNHKLSTNAQVTADQKVPDSSASKAPPGENNAQIEHKPTTVQQLKLPVSKPELQEASKGEEDCLGCRLVGSGAAFTAAGYVMYIHRQNKNKTVGFRRTLHLVQSLALSAGE